MPKDYLSNNRRSRRHDACYRQNQTNIQSHLNSFFPRSIRLWNMLPKHVVKAKSTESFKSNLIKSICDLKVPVHLKRL